MRGGLPAPVVAVEAGFEKMMGHCPSRVRNGSQGQCGLPRRRRAVFPKRGVGLSETLFPRLEIRGRVFAGYTFGRPTRMVSSFLKSAFAATFVISPRIKTSKESSKDTVGYIQVLPGG